MRDHDDDVLLQTVKSRGVVGYMMYYDVLALLDNWPFSNA